jgi:hypothetical protein
MLDQPSLADAGDGLLVEEGGGDLGIVGEIDVAN